MTLTKNQKRKIEDQAPLTTEDQALLDHVGKEVSMFIRELNRIVGEVESGEKSCQDIEEN